MTAIIEQGQQRTKCTQLLSLLKFKTWFYGEVSIVEGCNCILTCFNSNQGDKEHKFQSCTSVRDDLQFSVQLANTSPAQPDTNQRHQRNRTFSVEELLVQGSLLAPGMEIPPKQAKQVGVAFTAKYVHDSC